MLLSGGAGSGKTTLCLQYLYEGATRFGEPGLYVSYEEEPAQIIANARRFGWDLQSLIDSGPPADLLHAAPEHRCRRATPAREGPCPRDRVEARGDRLADDDAGARGKSGPHPVARLHAHDDPPAGRLHLADHERSAGGTNSISRFGVEESIIDGVILLKMIGHERARTRYLEVYKLRGVSHASGDNLMKITPGGIRVFPRVEEIQ